ncbi:MAG: NAD(P)H-hydrate dehydratase [Spirochaetales bacterium]|nr:NAD(P)H-hydrate dehydratase [Spirochaetales bacterium]
MKIVTVKTMQDMDKKAIEVYRIPEILLMENAALAAYRAMESWLKRKKQRIIIFCGSGNNGGDGIALARKLHSEKHKVFVVLLSSPDKFGQSAQIHFQALKSMNIMIRDFEPLHDLEIKLAHCDIIVDALLGTGLARVIEGNYAKVVEMINRSGKKVISLDIPSGVNGNSGKIMGSAVKAHRTVSFGLPKQGNLLYPGFEQNGRLLVSHISFPPELYTKADSEITVSINKPKALPPRAQDGHKGSFGKGLFIAGSPSYLGAPYFAAHGFMKSGGGYSRLAADKLVTSHVSHLAPETVLCPQNTKEGFLTLKNLPDLLELSEKSDIVTIGPGLGLAEESQELVLHFIKKCTKPLIIDGDGLTALSRDLSVLQHRMAPSLLTPHLGEMNRLLSTTAAAMEHHEIDQAAGFCREHKIHLILKGAHSLIINSEGDVAMNLSGNAAMATAGSGDVLAGIAAALYCRYQNMDQAARASCFIHGVAGDLAARKIGPDGVTAREILDHLPRAMSIYDRKHKQVLKSYWPKII